eukprot:TRINITY_DN2983_c0_g1_i1.p2 TRINITY_DN2983_c0_g1~~TRINITY_DN2983_c0_g1_i1.p2  ORF type:complete len:386 (+),score=33.34 TRINITY_DN2983_c0_g1_i1:157-1158(+)
MKFVLAILLVLSAFLLQASSGNGIDSLPDRLERTYAGESAYCPFLSADVSVNNDVVRVNEEAIVQAVAQSFAASTSNVDSAAAQATATAQVVLEVTAEAIAEVAVKINTPNPGCWALGFGRAKAVAVAQAVVQAIASAIAQATGDSSLAALAFAQASSTQVSIDKAVESVALLLARGDGSGVTLNQANTVAQAKVTAVACVMAQAFAAVFQGTSAEAQAIVEIGCPPSFAPSSIVQNEEGCLCLTKSSTVPNNCGAWGGADNICYVQRPDLCSCAVNSKDFPGQKWRFCGSTLSEMQSFLSIEDATHDITAANAGFGYCTSLSPENDVEVQRP